MKLIALGVRYELEDFFFVLLDGSVFLLLKKAIVRIWID